jgi:phosphatidylinositol alpha 1,6-mannosyltransferase
MKKRVALVTESFLPSANGVTNSVVRVLETLKQRDYEAQIIAPTRPSPSHLGFPIHEAAAIPVLQFPVAVPGPSVAKVLDQFQPDVIHVAAPFLLGSQALLWAHRRGVPSVAVYQTDLAGYLDRYRLSFAKSAIDRMIGSIHASATVNLAPTPQTADYLRNLGVPNVHVWGRGVDSDLFNPKLKGEPETAVLRNRLAPDGERIVGFVGRLAAEKQVHRMAELFDLPDTRFVVVGDGPERSNLEATFAGKPITFLGKITGLELATAYAALDVFVHFGTEETFGQTIQEAQATGLPVVAPRVGGPVHLIRHGETGLLADPGASLGTGESYRDLVAALLADQTNMARISEAARQEVQHKTWANNNQQLLEYYEFASQLVADRERSFELA